MKKIIYYPKNQTLHFKLGGHGITLHANKVLIAFPDNKKNAENVLKHLKSVINKT